MADDPSLLVTIVLSFVLVLMTLAFFIGRISDPIWKARIQRMTDKTKDFYLVGFVDKSGMHITDYVLNINHGILEHKGKIWIGDKGRIFDQSNPTNGFFPGTRPHPNESGLPRIFINEDSFMCMTFWEESTHVKPDEVGSELKAWVDNQIAKAIAQFAKAFASIKNHQMLLYVCIAIGLGCIGIVWWSGNQTTSTLTARLDIIETHQNQTVIKEEQMMNILKTQFRAAYSSVCQQILQNGTLIVGC